MIDREEGADDGWERLKHVEVIYVGSGGCQILVLSAASLG